MKRRRNVLVAHFRPDVVSGAELAISDMLGKAGDRFRFIMLTPGEGKLAKLYRERGFEVWSEKVQTKRRKYPGLHTVQSYLFARKMRREDIDAVLCNTFPAASRLRTACVMSGIPCAIYVREYISDKPLHREILAQADRVFAVSRDMKDYLVKMADPSNIIVSHDHVDPRAIVRRVALHEAAGSRLLPFGPGRSVVGLIGRITGYKQQDLFVRAIPAVTAHVPEARFVVVGSAQKKEEDYEDEVRKLALELGVMDKVAFMGHRDDAIEIMSELSVLCLTSDREPFPRTALEAQLVGCPVIAPKSGGCPEMVEDGQTGLLYSSTGSDSARQLAERIIALLTKADLGRRLVFNAKEKISRTFAGEEPVRRFEQGIESVIRLRRPEKA